MINVIVDLSHHNRSPDFNQAAASGLKGVIYKASQGQTGTDPTFKASEAKARAAGLYWGAYHFATGSDGVKQAENFLSQIGDPAKTLMVLDFEPNLTGPSMSLSEAQAFVTHVANQTGRFPGFYSGHYIKQLLGNGHDPLLAKCWFWLAQYGPTAVVPPNWSTWTMWQYTDGAIGPKPHDVPGIGLCDRDQFNGNQGELDQLWPH